MNRIEIQKLLSIDGYWTINKHLARIYGYTATVLLQQLIELQCEYFPNGDFYQQQDELAKKLGITEKVLVNARKKLTDGTDNPVVLIARRGHGAKYYYTVLLDNITKLFESNKDEFSDITKGNVRKEQKVPANRKKQEQKEIIQEEIIQKELSSDEILLNKIIELYPGNVNARGPLLKALQSLTKEEKILAIKNIERYKIAANGFYLNLKNYLESKAFSEIELTKKEQANKLKNKTNKPDTKTFNGNYENF
jgi:hypothetical protein